MLTFQKVITNLQKFWIEKGCLLAQSYEIEAGAGTFHPETFLRCLGPEPYNVVGTAISKRPTDGRYGLNPNRLQRFHQLQVIMKPSPKDFQALYLESLESIGLKIKEHDIRFVHDDWESPTQGAWGLGWEVWCDGMEITQFTYFQSIGGQALTPIAGEIAYGLERICMFLQGKDNVYDIEYDKTHTYGQLFLESEKQACQYNFELANTKMWQSFFDAYEAESLNLIEKKLATCAYDFAIKASHAFNMLDARGAVSVSQRVGLMHRIKHLCTKAAQGYIEHRKELGFPLLQESQAPKQEEKKKSTYPLLDSTDREDFLLEIGSEEIPAAYASSALISFKRELESLLNKLELSFENIEYFCTQRRIAALVKNLSAVTREQKIEKKGPPIDRIYDQEGLINKQGLGFFQSADLEPLHKDELDQDNSKKVWQQGEYIFVRVIKEAKSAQQLLEQHLGSLIAKIAFPKSMRWQEYSQSFARPIRWIVGMIGKKTLNISYAGVTSSNITFGHKQRYNQEIVLSKPKHYEKKLEKGYVLANIQKRKALIEKELEDIKTNLHCIAINQEELIKEILFLSEYPTLATCEFDKSFLTLPKELLVSEMHDHQRYFPLEKEGFLLNKFVVAIDKKPTPIIKQNNEKVLRARLCDASFLMKKDEQTPIEKLNEKLANIIFHKDFGSMQDKMLRIKDLSQELSDTLKLEYSHEALKYLKSDLSSYVVDEFPDLQGVIGKYLAIHEGIQADDALAIQEHYMPTSEGSSLPSSNSAIIFSLADKLDNLISYTKLGIKASASKDPYALRRNAIAILRILIEKGISIDLCVLCKNHKVETLIEFFKGRLPSLFIEYGFDAIEIQMANSKNSFDPYDLFMKAKALNEIRDQSDTFDQLLELIKRLKGQIKGAKPQKIQAPLFTQEHEKLLYQKLESIKQNIDSCMDEKNYTKALATLIELKEPVKDFFDNVRINVDQEDIKNNRTALLQEIYSIASTLIG